MIRLMLSNNLWDLLLVAIKETNVYHTENLRMTVAPYLS